MKKLLILNQQSPVVTALLPLLAQNDEVAVSVFQGDLQSAADYGNAIKNVDWLLSALGPNDVDLVFEALFDAIDEVGPAIQHFIMLSYAGIDDELTAPMTFPKVANRSEFIKQQRYAAKLVDESEIPYSIIRMGTLTSANQSNYQLYNEGSQMPNGRVSAKNVARLVEMALVNHKLVNQSVGIIDEAK
ncbi:NAD(P)-binding oxidoreductase [Lentilactobacillus farraginis]|uniref:Saccharopine dehydrogenase related protein n=1 Tax=Lentilactobacillus farraginis DSM 18382 = JCM 14108 TaxID=1423743 RepID=X0PK76_9LACO|nr:NAD(P)-binding oxidoreductase [Lentilactobacillus farraginis]KRM05490.1 saccharopine dehydrogenase related protein [Lentilactobacillus farraginis DSM 18382 = JCM 14108]GAF37697.1 saccharopine dehydrogenase related protein [Lentilactobacillus farraginis DSM 18382 = JCM 14108]